VARHRGVDERCYGGHIGENPLVDRREAEAQADPRDLAFISVQPHLKIGLNSPFEVNRSLPGRSGSRRLELARPGRSNGSRRSLAMALSCGSTDPMRHRPACIQRGRLGPYEGGVAQKFLVCIVLLEQCPRCEAIRNSAPTESPLSMQVTRRPAQPTPPARLRPAQVRPAAELSSTPSPTWARRQLLTPRPEVDSLCHD
jgi:hypothetical protein